MLPYGRKKSSAVPLFRSGRRSLVCAKLRNKGKRELRGQKPQVSTLLPTAVGTANLLPSADGNSPLRFSKKLSARTESIANATRVPRLIGAEKA